MNNPIRFIDPNGMDPLTGVDAQNAFANLQNIIRANNEEDPTGADTREERLEGERLNGNSKSQDALESKLELNASKANLSYEIKKGASNKEPDAEGQGQGGGWSKTFEFKEIGFVVLDPDVGYQIAVYSLAIVPSPKTKPVSKTTNC
jgi:hypothetical protein